MICVSYNCECTTCPLVIFLISLHNISLKHYICKL
uniref:Uncharacterized protein n=1 Tax=Anguilla anguilla TaxID=7936 RepID=A0A0E9XCR2_ANGAN